MQNGIYETVQRLSVRQSVPSFDSSSAYGGFAAERHVGRRYRSTAAGAQQQRSRGTALSSKRGQCHVDSRGTRLNTDLLSLKPSFLSIFTIQNKVTVAY